MRMRTGKSFRHWNAIPDPVGPEIGVALPGTLSYSKGMKHPQRAAPDRTGRAPAFSVIELLIVVTLLLILTAMLWGFESRGSRKQKSQVCQSNLQKLFIALDIYANDYTGSFPAPAGARSAEAALAPLVPKYNTDLAIFICPGAGDAALRSGVPLGEQRISYAYYSGTRRGAAAPLVTDRQVDANPKAPGQLIFSADGKPPGNNHRQSGGNVLRSNGRVEHLPATATAPLGPATGATLLNPKP